MIPFPFPGFSVAVMVPSSGFAPPVTPSEPIADMAITMPFPESRSEPGAMMSIAEDSRAVFMPDMLIAGSADNTRAATEAAAGAAAEGP